MVMVGRQREERECALILLQDRRQSVLGERSHSGGDALRGGITQWKSGYDGINREDVWDGAQAEGMQSARLNQLSLE